MNSSAKSHGSLDLRSFVLFPLSLCWVAVHCGIYIYKGSCNVSNISYLNSPSLSLSFILPSPDSWNSFKRYHFYIYIHEYTLFALYSSSYPFLCHLPHDLKIFEGQCLTQGGPVISGQGLRPFFIPLE
jgi:hypothetical protein